MSQSESFGHTLTSDSHHSARDAVKRQQKTNLNVQSDSTRASIRAKVPVLI